MMASNLEDFTYHLERNLVAYGVSKEEMVKVLPAVISATWDSDISPNYIQSYLEQAGKELSQRELRASNELQITEINSNNERNYGIKNAN